MLFDFCGPHHCLMTSLVGGCDFYPISYAFAIVQAEFAPIFCLTFVHYLFLASTRYSISVNTASILRLPVVSTLPATTSYCARLVQADPETKARVLPWLAPAVERAGPFGGADGGGGEDTTSMGDTTRKRAAGKCGEGSEVVGTAGGLCSTEIDKGSNKEEDELMRGERGLCRLVQASTAAAAGTVER